MDSTASGVQVLTDLWFTAIKLLGRPIVQVQLAAGLGAVLLAWLISRAVLRHWGQRRRDHVMAELDVARSQPRSGEPSLQQQAAESTVFPAEMAFNLPTPWYYSLLWQLIYPILALAFVAIVNFAFVSQGLTNGLLIDLMWLLGVFLVYRFVISLFYILFDNHTAAKYHYRLFAPLFVVVVAVHLLNELTNLQELARAPIFAADAVLTVGTLFAATFGLYLWIMLVAVLKDLGVALLARRRDVNPGSVNATLTLVQYGLIALGLFAVFHILQLNTATVAAIAGGLSIGLAFAMQDVLKNFIGGLIILFEGSVRPGDWVEIAGTEGAVDKLSIRSTIVRTRDNVEYIVPNQDWLNSTVTTYTRTSRSARARISIGVSYDANPHFVRQLLMDAAAQHPKVLTDPPPNAVLVNFGDSSIDFIVLAWVADAATRAMVAGEVRLMIWDALAEAGVEIPYPQQDLHIRSGLPHALSAQASNGGQFG